MFCSHGKPLLAEAPLCVHGGFHGPLNQGGGNVNRDVGPFHGLVGLQVLTFQVGVDRHLERATSTNRWDEIHCHDAAAFSGEVEGALCHVKLHCLIEP